MKLFTTAASEAPATFESADSVRHYVYNLKNPMKAGMRKLLGLSGNLTKEYSPVILCTTWPVLWKILFLVLFSILGTVGNGFFIAAFFVEDSLRRAGNVYLACTGLSDMIVTTVVIPTSVIFLLSDSYWDVQSVCPTLQTLIQASTYSYSLLFMMVSLETYYKLCRTRASYQIFISIPVGFIAVLVFVVSFITSAAGVYLDLDYDYCERKHHGNYKFRMITAVIFQVFPFLISLILLLATALVVRARAQRLSNYKRSYQYDQDSSFSNINVCIYLVFIITWIPYLAVVNLFPDTSDHVYYTCVWIGVSRSLLSSILYACVNRVFRHAFVHLFCYCCCKSTMVPPYNHRHRRVFAYKVTSGDVKVHILHHTVNSPQRNNTQPRQNHSVEM